MLRLRLGLGFWVNVRVGVSKRYGESEGLQLGRATVRDSVTRVRAKG